MSCVRRLFVHAQIGGQVIKQIIEVEKFRVVQAMRH